MLALRCDADSFLLNFDLKIGDSLLNSVYERVFDSHLQIETFDIFTDDLVFQLVFVQPLQSQTMDVRAEKSYLRLQ